MSGFMFTGIFWGIMLMLLGVAIIVKVVFKLDIQLFRIVFALIFIGIGIEILIGGTFMRGKKDANTVIFDENNEMKWDGSSEHNEYDVIFGKGNVDLTQYRVSEKRIKVRVSTVFGAADIWVSSQIPARVRVSSVFGSARLPDNDVVSFGHHDYKTASFDKDKPYLDVEASVVFGAVNIKTKNTENE